jgi:Protein of unknown function (DUF3667)
MTCKNCHTEIVENYCPKCGQSATFKRIDKHYITHEIEHLFHFEKGFPFTIKALLTKPGETIRSFLAEDRGRLVKPITFIIVTSLLYSIVSGYFHIDEFFIKIKPQEGSSDKFTVFKVVEWFKAHYGYTNLLSGAFVAIWLKVFFKKYGYNFFELLVLLCYVMGISMFISTVFAIIEGISHLKISGIATFLGWIYSFWAMGSFFEKKKIMSYVKATICYMLGFTTFIIVALGIGFAIDFIMKK